MTVQTIVTPAGERLVLISEADYRDLLDAVEDAVDGAAVDELSEIESGQVEGSVATIRRIAAALGLSIDDLVI